MDKVYYFAYGSNLDTTQLKERNFNIIQIKRAAKKGFKLVFNKLGTDGYARANIEPSPNSIVEGIAIETDEESLNKMDIPEGVPNHYTRESIEVEIERIPTTCQTYIANPIKLRNNLKITKKYMERIITGAKEHKLPEEYIDKLKKIKTI